MIDQQGIRQILERMRFSLQKMQLVNGAFQDPRTKICDPRPNAECARALLVINDIETAKKALDWVVREQQANGSWKEITETETVEENTLSTAVIARVLMDAYQVTKKNSYIEAAKKACKYIKEQEFEPGRYVKSDNHYADLLNMSAAAAAVFQKMEELSKNSEVTAIKNRALLHIARHQFKNGAFPYATLERAFPYEEHMNVRDLYYHSLTLFYLLLANPKDSYRHATFAQKRAFKWLAGKIRKRTPWRKSKVIFTVGSTGFYAYGAYSLARAGKNQEANLCIKKLEKLQKEDGLFSRYEKPFWPDAFWGYLKEIVEYEKICPTRYSLAHRMMRLRRRLAHDLKARRRKKTSLFYSAQIYNALSELLVKQ